MKTVSLSWRNCLPLFLECFSFPSPLNWATWLVLGWACLSQTIAHLLLCTSRGSCHWFHGSPKPFLSLECFPFISFFFFFHFSLILTPSPSDTEVILSCHFTPKPLDYTSLNADWDILLYSVLYVYYKYFLSVWLIHFLSSGGFKITLHFYQDSKDFFFNYRDHI